MNKQEFLSSIKSKTYPLTKSKYKRVSESTIRYAGGKSLAVGYLVEHLPNNIGKVVSPFFGGGSFEIAINKFLGVEIIGYDIFDILCNFWNYQLNYQDELYNELIKIPPTKDEFERVRKILNKVWKKELVLDPLMLAVYYVYNFNLSYGPGFMGWSSDIYLDNEKYHKMINRIKTFKPNNISVKCNDFQDVLKEHKNDFLYLDPPYFLEGDSKMFRGLYPMRNIPVHHNGFKHEELQKLLLDHKGGFILSYNDCSAIREYYKKFNIYEVEWQYTMGQGETRIGANRVEKSNIKKSHEIIICS